MDTLNLLEEARRAGLRVSASGKQLVVRGPKSAKRLAEELLERKSEVLPLVCNEAPSPPQPPSDLRALTDKFTSTGRIRIESNWVPGFFWVPDLWRSSLPVSRWVATHSTSRVPILSTRCVKENE